jgi:hypothetical protein
MSARGVSTFPGYIQDVDNFGMTGRAADGGAAVPRGARKSLPRDRSSGSAHEPRQPEMCETRLIGHYQIDRQSIWIS